MSGTAIICGYGPGISDAVATKFGKEGFKVAIVARNADNLAKGVERLKGKGVAATAFPADLSNIETVKKSSAISAASWATSKCWCGIRCRSARAISRPWI